MLLHLPFQGTFEAGGLLAGKHFEAGGFFSSAVNRRSRVRRKLQGELVRRKSDSLLLSHILLVQNYFHLNDYSFSEK
jgi:hypothetical protein